MHVSGFPVDLNWFLQFIATAFVLALGLLYLVKNTASNYFVVDANFDTSDPKMPGPVIQTRDASAACIVCSKLDTKQCSRCKMVRYCSEACQRADWNSGHKTKCKDFQLLGKINLMQSASVLQGRKASAAVPLGNADGTSNILNQSKEILFPYEEFVELFNGEKPGFPPCGLLNCGNSCFANVVLQCLACTRPLVAYLLEKGHQRKCRRNDWCFLCEFQVHVERASRSVQPFSPFNILSRLPNIGGNLGYGKQEDAHEFMRFAIDTMQSVCLDEFGGEKFVHPSSQETTLIQHIFGGHLQSQVICTKCNNVSNQFENMMDLNVEIQGDAVSLEECLDQFTVRERLHGDNMYKCDGCNDYVLAWKRLTVRRAPNILTIALKRFQSGRFGKLNKRVTFPETLDLSPYMSEAGDGSDVYKLYAVVVHVDMLNASFFGHYICYIKNFSGNWYRIDDCKVTRVELDEVLSQGAYMLLYSRVCARPLSLNDNPKTENQVAAQEVLPCPKQPAELIDRASISGSFLCDSSSQAKVCSYEEESSSLTEGVRKVLDMVDSEASSSVSKDVEVQGNGCSNVAEESVTPIEHGHGLVYGVATLTDKFSAEAAFPVSSVKNGDEADESCAEECVLIDSSIEGSVPAQNHVGENGEMPHDFSSGTEDAVGKLDGRNSRGAKSNPLFAYGFLGKRPQNKYIKQDGRAPTEPSELANSTCNLNGQSNGFAKPDLAHQNGGEMEDEERPHFESCSSSPSNFLEKQTGKLRNEDQMVASVESVNLCVGDSDAPQVSDSPVEHGHRLVSWVSTLTDTYPAEAYVLKHKPPFPVSDVENGTEAVESNAKECVLIDSSTRASVPTQNLVCEKGEMSCKTSVATLSSGEVLDETNSINFRRKPEKVEYGKDVQSSSGTEDAGKLDGRNSHGAKLKPLLAPGFLGKRPRNNVKHNGRASAEHVELAYPCNLNGRSNGFAKPDLSHRNDGETKDEERPHFDYDSSVSPNFLEKQTGESWNEYRIVINESGASVYLCNGDCDVPILCNESISNISMDVKLVVVDQTSTGKLDQLTGTTPSRKTRTNSE